MSELVRPVGRSPFAGWPAAGVSGGEIGRPVPARISMALDMRELDGPEVDVTVGTEEGRSLDEGGDVDDWEAARSSPTPCQVTRLVLLTAFPPAWFHQPLAAGRVVEGGWICYRDKRGCQPIVPDVITEDGVLLYEGRPRDPKRPAVQSSLFEPAPRPASSRPQRPQRPAGVRSARPVRPAAPAVVQVTIDEAPRSSRMPAHLRAELDRRLAARRVP